MEIKVKDRIIAHNQPTFVIAEAACNHLCDMNLAKQMIDKAVEAGADSIKFQTYKAEKLVTSDAVAFWVSAGNVRVDRSCRPGCDQRWTWRQRNYGSRHPE